MANKIESLENQSNMNTENGKHEAPTDFANEETFRPQQEQMEAYVVLSKLREQFVTLYYADFTTDYMHTYKTDENYGPKYGVTQHYSVSMGGYVENDVAEKDRERMRQATDPACVMERFKTEDAFELEFEDHSFGDVRYCSLRYIKANEAGTCAVICGSDVTAQKKEERERSEAQKEQLAIFDALANSYSNVYLIDPVLGTLRVLKLSGYLTTGVERQTTKTYSYETVKDQYVSERVHPDDQEMMKKAISMAEVKSALAEDREYTGNYRVLANGETHHYQFKYMRLKHYECMIAGFQCIDDIVDEQIAHQEELERQFAIIDSLSSDYVSIYLANLNEGTGKAIRISHALGEEVSNAMKDKTFDIETTMKMWIGMNVHPDDRDRMLQATDLNTVRKAMAVKDEYAGNYRSNETGEFHNYQFVVRKVDDNGNVIVGFQIIDAIIKEHEAQAKRERELEEASLRNEKERNDIIKSLSNIYSTIIKVEIETHRYEVFSSVSLMDSVGGKGGNFDDTKEALLTNFMAPEMRERMSTFLDFDTLAERLQKVNTIAIDYKAPSGQWVQARFVVKLRDENGVAKEALYVVRDITEEKNRDIQQQEALSHALTVAQHDKEELQKAQTQLKDSLAITDALSRDYSNVFLVQLKNNRAKIVKEENYNVKEIKGSSAWFDYSVIIRKYIETRVYEPDAQMMLEETKLSNVLAKIETNSDFSISFRALAAGEVHYLEMRYVSIEGADLVAVGFRYVDDIVKAEAEQKQALQEALAAAQQANKAKTTFLNSMSHDIRTPMNAIIGFTALAQTHLDNPSQVEDYLSKISTSSNHLLSLINDILDMSRIESGTVKLDEKAVHIPDLLHDLRTMIQSLVNSKNLNLFIDTQDVVHEDVLTDKLRLNQVLLNIAGNAIKFTQPGGDIIIRLIEKPCSVKHHAAYEFSVKDNGIGMSKEFIGHIFDTFSREYSSTVSGIQGTGLGMAITKNIVDMMGGDIQVESEEGKGSLFTVTLNLRLANEPTKNEPIPELLGARALIVDDDMNTCRSVSKMLRDIEMRPDWTVSGKEAIVRAQDAAEMKDEYKVYIIDYLMPDMNGIETVRRIRKVISEDVPIIVLTAYDWSDFEHEAREAGVTAFVSKPIFMSELRAVLTQPVVSEKIAKEEEAKVSHDYSGKHVLLVEDNELNREIATALLEETGMTIDSVEDGDVAVATIVREPADKYDLILMDIQMPRMDGYTATREIRTLADNVRANIPIVAMTANAFEEDKRKAYESGMNGHIIKPISIEEIAKVLDEVFASKK